MGTVDALSPRRPQPLVSRPGAARAPPRGSRGVPFARESLDPNRASRRCPSPASPHESPVAVVAEGPDYRACAPSSLGSSPARTALRQPSHPRRGGCPSPMTPHPGGVEGRRPTRDPPSPPIRPTPPPSPIVACNTKGQARRTPSPNEPSSAQAGLNRGTSIVRK